MTEGAWNFCPHCGHKIAFTAQTCPACHAPTGRGDDRSEISPKSYGTAITLCGIFGTMGIHHFYLGNIMHGLFDLGLLVATVLFWIAGETTGSPAYFILAIVLFLIDAIHTIIVFYRLIAEQEHDGQGRLVAATRT